MIITNENWKDIEIVKAQWINRKHESVTITINAIDKSNNPVIFNYVSSPFDSAPMNVQLWQWVMDNPDEVKECYEHLIEEGLEPVPEGYVLRNGMLFNIEMEKQRVIAAVNAKLDELYSGVSQAKAERDPVYAENRRLLIDALLNVENSEGFPFEVDLSKLEDEA